MTPKEGLAVRAARNKSEAKEAFILRLPDELLSIISETVLQSSDGEHDRLSLGALSRTCRKIRLAAAPVLFRQLDYNWGVNRAEFRGFPGKELAACEIMLSIVRNSQGSMVRVADLWSLTQHLHFFRTYRPYDYDPSDTEMLDHDREFTHASVPLDRLQEVLGVGVASWPRGTGYQKNQDAEGNRDEQGNQDDQTALTSRRKHLERMESVDAQGGQSLNPQTLVILLALVALPNLLKLRIPVSFDSLRLLKLPRKASDYPLLMNTEPGYVSALYPQHFPSLSRLRELDLIPSCFGEGTGRVRADNFSWIVERSPDFRTLRLCNMAALGGKIEDFSLPCQNITTLSLISCDLPDYEVMLLLLCCPRLKLFKMDKSDWSQDHRWYHGSEAASVMLEVLTNAAPHIQKVFLGRCVRPSTFRKTPHSLHAPPNAASPLPIGGLRNLKTLGLTMENLYQHGWTDADEAQDAQLLARMVRQCPSLESLQLFNVLTRKDELTSLLAESLKLLGEELVSNNKANLKEIKLWYVDLEYYLRSVDDHEHDRFCGKIPPDTPAPWGKVTKRTIECSKKPMEELGRSGLVELYRSLGIKLTLEKEEGFLQPEECPRILNADYYTSTQFPSPGHINPDETLWSTRRQTRYIGG